MKTFFLHLLLLACSAPVLNFQDVSNPSESRSGCFDFAGQRFHFSYQKLGNEARFGDDMRLPMERVLDCESNRRLNLATENKFATDTTYLWRNNRIPYSLPANFPFGTELNFAISEWNKSGISWEIKTAQDTNYVDFVLLDANDTKISGACGTSPIGKVTGRQEIRLRTKETIDTCGPVLKRTLLHEMGHSMGFMHEHQRSDRDDYISFNSDISSNIWLAKIEVSTSLSPYDVNSVMHYSTEQVPNLRTKNGDTIPHNQFLSQNDIDGARKLYGTPLFSVSSSAYSMQEDIPKAFSISADAPDNTLACNENHWSYTSLNPEIVPVSGAVSWSGNWSEAQRYCTITITPSPNASGTATLTLTLKDGSFSTTKNITVDIAPANDPPTIASIQAQSTVEDSATTIPLTVGDVDNTLSCSSSNFSYTSSNALIVATNGAVSWGGTWPACTATITPVANASGTTQLTFNLSDGQSTGSAAFSYSVTSMNDTPTVSEISQMQSTNTNSTKFIAFSLDDVDAPLSCSAEHLSYTSSNPALVGASGAVQWSGSWPNCIAAITPRENVSGEAEVTLVVSDGTLRSSRSFRLAVSDSNEPALFSALDKEKTLLAGNRLKIALNLLPSVSGSNSISAPSACSELFMTSISSPDVLAADDFSIEGDAPNCTLNLNPKADIQGSTRLTLGLKVGDEIRSQTISVKVKLLSASIKVSTLKSKAPVWVEFTGAESQVQATSKIVSFEWNFGDGTRGTSMNFAKKFTVPGEYEISLTVVDSSGKQNVEKVKITIED